MGSVPPIPTSRFWFILVYFSIFSFFSIQSTNEVSVDWAQLAQQWMAMKQVEDQGGTAYPPPYNNYYQGAYNNSNNSWRDSGDRYGDYSRNNGGWNNDSWVEPHAAYDYREWQPGPPVPPPKKEKQPMFPSAVKSGNAQFSGGQPPPPPPPMARPPARNDLLPVQEDWSRPGAFGAFGAFGSAPRPPRTSAPPPLPPPLMAKELPPPPPAATDHGGQKMFQNPASQPFFNMDAAARKKLPAWILEGLDKAEKEKQKQIEKEEKLRLAEEAKSQKRAATGRSKFDSSSDEEEDKPDVQEQKEEEEEEEKMNIEEKKENFSRAVRLLMMKVLLVATDAAVANVVDETLREVQRQKKANAAPQLVTKSNALAALANLGGDEDSDNDISDTEEAEKEEPKTSNDVFKAPTFVPKKPSKVVEPVNSEHEKPKEKAPESPKEQKSESSRKSERDSEESRKRSRRSDERDRDEERRRKRSKEKRRRSRSKERRRSRSRERKRR